MTLPRRADKSSGTRRRGGRPWPGPEVWGDHRDRLTTLVEQRRAIEQQIQDAIVDAHAAGMSFYQMAPVLGTANESGVRAMHRRTIAARDTSETSARRSVER